MSNFVPLIHLFYPQLSITMVNDNNDDLIKPKVTQKVNWTKYDNFNLKYWNANSIRNKLYTIENEIHTNTSLNKTIHFIAITETRIFPHQTEFYNIQNYNAFFNCRNDGYGGVALYVHESINSNLIESSEEHKINYVIVRIPDIRSCIAVVYKKPSVSFSIFSSVLTKILTKTNRIILIGDTNIDIQKINTQTLQYLTLIESLGCHLLNSTDKKYATRINKHRNARHTTSSTIDHIITNNHNFKFNLGINDSHISDHQQLFASFHDTSNTLNNFAHTSHSFVQKRLNLDLFKRIMRREINTYKPDNFHALIQIISNVKNRCIDTRTMYIKYNPYKKWISDELIHVIAQRNRYHTLTKRFPTNEYAKKKYFEHCEYACSLNNRLRRDYNSNRLNKYLHKPRQLWKCFNEIIHNKPYTPNDIKSLNLPNGNTTNDPNIISNAFNDYFCSIGRELSTKIPNTEPTYHSLIPFNSRTMALFPTTAFEIDLVINSIKSNANLSDILPINHIKECRDIFIEPITTCINKCFENGSFPEDLKCAKIIPIFKNGDSLSMENYRPISILFDFSKIIEQIIYERIYNFAKKCNIIDSKQFGFQRCSGTLSAAMSLLENIKISLDTSNKNITACLFLDISKAFDTIIRILLMSKLYRYGFRGKSYELIFNYLNNRTQYVTINNTKGNTLPIEYGTPQGSTLGPLLFLLYINDIFKLKLNGNIVMFADDAAISYCATNVDDLNRMMMEDIINLNTWFESNKLTLNLKKSKCMIIHPNQKAKKHSLNITLNNVQIEQVQSFEYLGLTIQEDLHWDLQISKICTKMSRIAGVMGRLGNNVHNQFLTSIYYAHIQSHISYMSPIWGHSLTEQQTASLQVAQNNAIRSIFRKEYYGHGLSTIQIRRTHNIFTVRQVIKYNTAVLAFKIDKKIIKTDLVINLRADMSRYITRNAHSMHQRSFRTNIGRFCTSRVVAVEYNQIPNSIKNSETLNNFKKRIKTSILDAHE